MLVKNCQKELRKHYEKTLTEEFNALTDNDTEILKKVKEAGKLPFDTEMVYLVNRGYLIGDNGTVYLAQKGESALELLGN